MVTRTTGKRKVVKNTFSQDLIDTVFEREVNVNSLVIEMCTIAPKSLQMVIAAMELKDAYSLEGKL